MTALSVLVLGDAPGAPDGGLPLLAGLGSALRPGDRLVWVAGRAEAAFRLRLAAETDGWPEGVPLALPDPPRGAGPRGLGAGAPGWPRHEALAAGLALLRALPEAGALVTLPADLPPGLAAPRLAAIRAALADGADLIELRFAETQSLFRSESVVLPLLHLGPGEADPEPLAIRHARRAARRPAVLTLDGPAPPVPEAGPAAALGLAAVAAEDPQAAAADLPAFLSTAPPGARAAAAPILPAAGLTPPAPAPAPPIVDRARLKVSVIGRHALRSPFSYPALADLRAGWAEVAPDPGGADLICLSHPLDLWDIDPVTAETVARTTLVLFSEEPFWDSLFSPDPLAPVIDLPAAHLGTVRLHQANHHRSAVFDWRHLPYLMFTDDRTIPRYRGIFARNAGVGPWGWRWRLARTRTRATFMAERREEAFHDLHLPEGDIEGLCAWRTRVALAAGERDVRRLGASWQGGPTRFQLEDWHADKLAQLDRTTRVLSALENTHQPTYLSEKFFDAFACGARPLYRASPAHRVHRLDLPAASWLNAWGLDEDETARAACEGPGQGFFRAYVAAQRQLAARFADAAAIAAERRRMGAALRAEVTRLADAGPAR